MSFGRLAVNPLVGTQESFTRFLANGSMHVCIHVKVLEETGYHASGVTIHV